MSSITATFLQVKRECTSLVMAESREFWKNYTSFIVDVDHTTLMPRAMDWWQEQVMFYYVRACWIAFIIVLAYWNTITAEGNG
jgi:hypothetical protein